MTSQFFQARTALAFIFVTAVLDVVAMGIVVPVLPLLIKQLVGSHAQAAFINGSFVALWALIQLFASPVIGALSDQWGRRPVILTSSAGLVGAYIVMALAPSLGWLALGRVLGGVTSASVATVYAYMGDITPPEKRARAYGFIGAAFSGGLVAGPLLGGLLSELSPRAPFWAASALSGLALLYGTFVLPESLRPERRMPFSWRRASPFGAVRLLRSHHDLFGFARINFLMYFSLYVVSTVLVLYASARYGWSPWRVGMLFATLGLLDMFVQSVLVGPVTRRLGDRATLTCGLLLGSLGVASLGLMPTGMLFVFAVALCALRCLAPPTLQSLMTRCVSETEQGRLQGANMSTASIAGLISPPFFGVVYSMSVTNSASPFSYPGAAFLIAAFVLLLAGVLSMGTSIPNALRARTTCESSRVQKLTESDDVY